MEFFEYWWNAEDQLILSDPCILEAEEAFCGNDEQPLLDILKETVGKPLPASLSKLLSDIHTGKVKRRKGVPKKFTLTHTDIIMIGCMVRDLRNSGAKLTYALQDVADFYKHDHEFEQRLAELDSLKDSVGPPMISLTRVKLAYKAFQAMEREQNKPLSKTSSHTR